VAFAPIHVSAFAVEIRGLTKRVSEVTAVDAISSTFEGEFFSPWSSGCGKTTLLRDRRLELPTGHDRDRRHRCTQVPPTVVR
jgi:hypothetical protein